MRRSGTSLMRATNTYTTYVCPSLPLRLPHQLLRFFRPEHAEHLVFFSHQSLIRDEEFLDVTQELFVEVADGTRRIIFPWQNRHGEQAIVALHFPFLTL